MSDDGGERLRESRTKQLTRQGTSKLKQPMPQSFDAHVVGVSFTPHYPDNLHQLELAWLDASMTDEPLAAVIVRCPDNPYDANACEVHIPALGEIGFVGHITAPLAARLAPDIDGGGQWQGHVVQLKINEKYPDRPGLEVHLERKT